MIYSPAEGNDREVGHALRAERERSVQREKKLLSPHWPHALADASLARHFGVEVLCEAPCLALYRGADTAAAELHVPAAELPALGEREQP